MYTLLSGLLYIQQAMKIKKPYHTKTIHSATFTEQKND